MKGKKCLMNKLIRIEWVIDEWVSEWVPLYSWMTSYYVIHEQKWCAKPTQWTNNYMYSGSRYARELTWISPFVLDCVTAVDVVFVVDSSGSIGEENFAIVKEVIQNLIGHFSVSAVHARIGIVQYATNARIIYSLRQSQRFGFRRLERRVKNLFYTKGGTKTGKGLSLAYNMLKRSKRRLYGKFLEHKQVFFIIVFISTATYKAIRKSYRLTRGYIFLLSIWISHLTAEPRLTFTLLLRPLFCPGERPIHFLKWKPR